MDVTHFTFAAIDVDKDNEKGNDQHNSKVIVVPFDGVAFDKDFGIPVGVKHVASNIPAIKQSINPDGESFSVRYSGYQSGNTEFSLFLTNGTLITSKNVTIDKSSGSFIWNELRSLPGGNYIMKVTNVNKRIDGGVFTKP